MSGWRARGAWGVVFCDLLGTQATHATRTPLYEYRISVMKRHTSDKNNSSIILYFTFVERNEGMIYIWIWRRTFAECSFCSLFILFYLLSLLLLFFSNDLFFVFLSIPWYASHCLHDYLIVFI